MLAKSVRAALDEITPHRYSAIAGWMSEMDGKAECLAAMLTDHRAFGPNGSRFFNAKADRPFIIRDIGLLLSGQDVGKWDTDPGVGTLEVFIASRSYFRVPLAAMPSHAGPIWQRRVSLPVVPHLVLMPGEHYAVEIEWKDAPSASPMVFLDGWLFRSTTEALTS